MKQVVKILTCVAIVMLLGASSAYAQPGTTGTTTVQSSPSVVVLSGAGLGGGLGMALTIMGAGYGMGKIGSAALESMARQPEVAPRIQTAMIIIAAMLEGATLASVILCYLIGQNARF